MSIPRYFTVEEVNALLPEIRPLMARLLSKRAKVVRQRRELEPAIDNPRLDFGGRAASEMTLEFVEIEQLIEKIQTFGCVIKSIDAGLLDWLTIREGRHVYLCWRYGEPLVEHYHDLQSGYNGRRRI